MKTYNPKNERIKHHFLVFCKDARGLSDASLDKTAKALNRFDMCNKYRDFKTFRVEQAVSFKERLFEIRAVRSGLPLSSSTVHSTLNVLRSFFMWLSGQRGYRSKLNQSDAEYFRVSMKEARVATARRIPRFPKPEQVFLAITSMPTRSEVELRDQALVALIYAAALRVGAATSLRIGDVDLEGGVVTQDARHVNTKYAKTIVTAFFPIEERIRAIVVAWVEYLRVEKGRNAEDPLFPASERRGFDRRPSPIVTNVPWQTTGPVRKVFRKAFERIGLPYFTPHSARHVIAYMGERICRTDAERKAWSQNMGHEHVRTTIDAYAPMNTSRQLEIMHSLSESHISDQPQSLEMERVFNVLFEQKIKSAMAQINNNR